MKIWTNYQVEMNETLIFWGEGNNILEIGDVVYLWQDRNRNRLGDEIIYGTASITRIIQNNYYEAERIA